MRSSFATPPELKTTTKIWPGGKGYGLEVAIPLKLLGMGGMPAGTRLLMDWDFIYGSARTQADVASSDWRFKLGRDPRVNAQSLLLGTSVGGLARAVRGPREEYTVYARPVRDDWARVADTYRATLKVAYDQKGLRFFTEVRDPNPGIFAAGGTGFIGMGDWMQVYVDGQDIYAVASPAYKAPYLVKGGSQPMGIPGAASVIKVGKASYTLEVSVPWGTVGGKKKRYTFNWRTAWSDTFGGAGFGQRLYRPENQPTTLVITP